MIFRLVIKSTMLPEEKEEKMTRLSNECAGSRGNYVGYGGEHERGKCGDMNCFEEGADGSERNKNTEPPSTMPPQEPAEKEVER